jgi:hypothetical protein
MSNFRFRQTLGVVLALGVCANAQEANHATPAGGPVERVKVHGHWTIEVRNPDGMLVTHREFENALQLGAFALGPILGRTATAGGWVVGVYSPNASGPCFQMNNAPVACYITEITDAYYGVGSNNVFPSLTVSAPFFGSPGAGTLTLTGMFTVQRSDQIVAVATGVEACAPTVAPSDCPPVSGGGNGSSLFFSEATIAPIPVSVGQLVQVTVVFSFS